MVQCHGRNANIGGMMGIGMSPGLAIALAFLEVIAGMAIARSIQLRN
jgi:hypothetical protein